MKKIRKLLAIALAATFSLGAIGCSGSKKEEPKKDETLKIVTTSEDYKKLFDKFTEDTNVKVEFLSMSSGEVLSRVKAEGDKPMADLWFGGGIDAFMQAKEDGLLQKCDFKDMDKLAPEFKDKEDYWFSKGITIVGFMVNNGVMKEKNLKDPKSWDDLTNPQYKGEILMSNPAVSGTNYAVVNALLQKKGEEQGWKYFEELNKNIEYYSKRGKDPSTKTMAGEVGIGITYIDKALEKAEKEKDVKIIYPEDGIPWVPEGVAIFKNAKNPELANKFLSWVYENENLKLLAEIDKKDTLKLIKPSYDGAELSFSKDKLIKENLSLFGKDRKEILDKWNAMVGNKNEK